MTTSPTVVSPSDAPSPPGWLARSRTGFTRDVHEITGVFRSSPEWVVIVFAWLAAAFIPAFWYMGEDHWWSQPNSPLFFEPFVPLFSAALLWQDRNRLQEAWQMTPRNKRHGSPLLLWIGCLLVLVSHLVHVLTVAAIGLVVVAAGIVYLGYGPFVLKASKRALLFALLFTPPPIKPLAGVANLISGSAWTRVTAALQRLGQEVSCSVGLDSTDLVIRGQVVNAPNTQLAAILISGFLLLFIGLWRRDKGGVVLLTMAFGGLIGGLLSMIIPFCALLLPPTSFSSVLVRTHPLVIVFLSVVFASLVRSRLAVWLSALAQRSRFVGKVLAGAQKIADRATAGLTNRFGGKVGRARQGANKGTEAVIDKFFSAISKPFKRKRRNRW